MKLSTMILAAAAIGAATPALAHHSFAMFDRTKNVTVNGEVKEYEWSNPHVWIHLMVADDAGMKREWSFEMQAIAQDYAAGWRSDSVKAGDKIRIEFHPLKDGSRGGQLMNATLADGKYLGPPVAPNRAQRPPAE